MLTDRSLLRAEENEINEGICLDGLVIVRVVRQPRDGRRKIWSSSSCRFSVYIQSPKYIVCELNTAESENVDTGCRLIVRAGSPFNISRNFEFLVYKLNPCFVLMNEGTYLYFELVVTRSLSFRQRKAPPFLAKLPLLPGPRFVSPLPVVMTR